MAATMERPTLSSMMTDMLSVPPGSSRGGPATISETLDRVLMEFAEDGVNPDGEDVVDEPSSQQRGAMEQPKQ